MTFGALAVRIVLNTLILLMLAALAGGGALHWKSARTEQAQLDIARAEVMRFQREINVRSAMGTEASSARGYPREVDPAWFEQHGLPINPLLGPRHPWLEIAGEDQRHLSHPPQRVAVGPHLARFWYNPATGAVRARVPAATSDATALWHYNFVNGTALTDLIADDDPESAQPESEAGRSRRSR